MAVATRGSCGPEVLSGVLTWLGLGAIACSAVAFVAASAYPGSLVAIPVLGAGLVIAGGMAARAGRPSRSWAPPVRWVGRISYSLYLWHWPILIIAADEAGKTSLPFRERGLAAARPGPLGGHLHVGREPHSACSGLVSWTRTDRLGRSSDCRHFGRFHGCTQLRRVERPGTCTASVSFRISDLVSDVPQRYGLFLPT